jgi:hypothetical protein
VHDANVRDAVAGVEREIEKASPEGLAKLPQTIVGDLPSATHEQPRPLRDALHLQLPKVPPLPPPEPYHLPLEVATTEHQTTDKSRKEKL